jgi:thiol-disulfide isomerase/thioredoxin
MDGEESGGTGRTVVTAVAVTAALLATAAVVAALGTRGGEPGDVARTVVVETPVPLDERPPPDRREPLPDLVLDGFDGAEPVDLAAYRGRPLVVNLWATWCDPCIEEMPDIERVAADLGDRVAILGVNTRDAPANAAEFARDLGISYDLAADPAGDLFREVGAFGMPTTLLVTADGTITYRHTGLLDADGLRRLVDERLGADAS